MTTRSSLRSAGPTAAAADRAEAALSLVAPELVDDFRGYLPKAADVVNRRLIGAAQRERLVGPPEDVTWTGGTAFLPLADGGVLVTAAHQHGFDRIEVDDVQPGDPAQLLERFAGADAASRTVGAELTDACVNLALAFARRDRSTAAVQAGRAVGAALDSLELFADLDPDEQCHQFERLATEGHNLHPCGRTRLGWSVPDLLAYDLESPGTEIGFVGVRRDLHVGDAIPTIEPSTLDMSRYAVTPVHPWQLRLIRDRYPDAVADGLLIPLDHTIPAAPTSSLRTLLVAPGLSTGDTRYLKVSLDIQVTSTRRTISVASTRNGPVLSRLLRRLFDETPYGDRIVVLAETAGAAAQLPDGHDRDLSAIARGGLTGQLQDGEVPIPGSALAAVSPVPGPDGNPRTILDEVLARFARGRGLSPRSAAPAFLDAYARLLLPPLLTLATEAGIGIEAHLQNCVPTFVNGAPHRLALRDFAGLRIYRPRLRHRVDLWPGSVIVADQADVMRSKVAYTAIQAHLGELVVQLVRSYGLVEAGAWALIRTVVDETYDRLRAGRHRARAEADHAFLVADDVPHKALLTMRLAAARGLSGDAYVRVGNPLR